MKRLLLAFSLSLVVGLGLGLLASACASVPVKQQLTLGVQTSSNLLHIADDSERALYLSKSMPGLTDAVHQKVSGVFVQAYTHQIQAETALLAWSSTQPYPASLGALLDDAQASWIQATAIFPGLGTKVPNEPAFVANLRAWIQEVITLAKTIGLTIPAALSPVGA